LDLVVGGVKMFFEFKAGVVRNGTIDPTLEPNMPAAPGAPGRADTRALGIRRAGRRIVRKGQSFRAKARRSDDDSGIQPENIVWIFGAGRTGSSWLSRMMGDLRRHDVWFEPWVGALFDPYHLQLEKRRGRSFILAPHYSDTWLASIRSLVLDGAGVRFPKMAPDHYLVIKEPGGSVGAQLLMEALPESRMILLIRDPRDVVASWVDAHKEGAWHAHEGLEDADKRTINSAKRYLHHVGQARRAYDAHGGRKAMVRYEDLRADTLEIMRRTYSELGISVKEADLARVVEKHSWDNIPEEEKGPGKRRRRATPGGWREDLTPEQAKTVERVTAPLLQEFYPNEGSQS